MNFKLNRELDEKFMNRTIELSEIAKDKGEDPFGAVLVKDSEIVFETHDGCIEFCDPTMHAERRLISEYCSKNNIISLEGYTLYSSAEPCSMCSGAIHWAKISRVVYGIPQEMLNSKSGGNKKISCTTIINQGKTKIEVLGSVLQEKAYKIIENYAFVLKKDRIKCK